MEDVKQICIDFDFDEEKIDDYLSMFEVNERFKDT